MILGPVKRLEVAPGLARDAPEELRGPRRRGQRAAFGDRAAERVRDERRREPTSASTGAAARQRARTRDDDEREADERAMSGLAIISSTKTPDAARSRRPRAALAAAVSHSSSRRCVIDEAHERQADRVQHLVGLVREERQLRARCCASGGR